ncbi:hypothetical protein PMAA_057010 [Talaromyces marneffei ATCC 18224]|uniref:Uncharacterized protein n=1 Tax=Talaromyces marneffei (strain ATCC 18224 / CBS 334.59 / QM 7333) TaxID=441960 RepID=B6QLD5_TALMQ|nr:hypothetical protein PMAA_057010 [Talaromyces marneffei ATCC 18224]
MGGPLGRWKAIHTAEDQEQHAATCTGWDWQQPYQRGESKWMRFGGAEIKREGGNDWRLAEDVKNGSPAGARPGRLACPPKTEVRLYSYGESRGYTPATTTLVTPLTNETHPPANHLGLVVARQNKSHGPDL